MQFNTHTSETKFAQFVFNYVSDHVYAIVRTGRPGTHVVRAGDLATAGTMLVTPVILYYTI